MKHRSIPIWKKEREKEREEERWVTRQKNAIKLTDPHRFGKICLYTQRPRRDAIPVDPVTCSRAEKGTVTRIRVATQSEFSGALSRSTALFDFESNRIEQEKGWFAPDERQTDVCASRRIYPIGQPNGTDFIMPGLHEVGPTLRGKSALRRFGMQNCCLRKFARREYWPVEWFNRVDGPMAKKGFAW